MAKFQLISQFLKDFSFESPNVPELFFKQENGQAKMDINLDIQIKGTENNIYMVDLIVKLHSKLEAGDKSIFMIESTYSGLVQVEKQENEEDLKKTLLIEVPNMLFPSVRAIILRMTGESGFPPFAMQAIDFEKLYEEKNKK
jgi:preprotein translocase subunit SecB